MHKRSDKVAEAIHELVSGLLVKGIKDPRIGFVTITGVKVTDDIRHATIFYTVIGTDEEKKATSHGLGSAIGFIRKEVGKELRLRFAPELVFKYDQSIEYGNRIDRLLKEIGSEDGDHD
ncbi:MAG: ribosome-binding factor A [Desulfuromonadales bacterium]|nr:MAG: ribosome-binding factor A [Desulfuromonadales bacterium]